MNLVKFIQKDEPDRDFKQLTTTGVAATARGRYVAAATAYVAYIRRKILTTTTLTTATRKKDELKIRMMSKTKRLHVIYNKNRNNNNNNIVIIFKMFINFH